MQVNDSPQPTIADVKRKLKNCAHELDDIITSSNSQQPVSGMVEQSLYRVREAISHLDSAEAKGN